jgi:hypothetical protein
MILSVESEAAEVNSGGVVMTVRAERTKYVIREPLKFQVRFTNKDTRMLHIIPPQSLGQNMEFMFYEIRYPDGSIGHQKTEYICINEDIRPDWVGYKLPPNESIETILYPPTSYFDTAGVYEVRMAYKLPKYYTRLWRPDAGVLYSNSVALEFRAPNAQEAAILDCYWEDDFDISLREFDVMIAVHEPTLRRAIERGGGNKLTKYLMLRLARSIVGESQQNPERARDAVVLLESLRNDDPEFRFEEVNYVLGKAYFNGGDRASAEDVFRVAASERRELYDLWWFTFQWMWFKTESYRDSADVISVNSRTERIALLRAQKPN